MQSKLSDLVDTLSVINNKDCKACMERKKSNQNVILLGLKIIDWITDVKKWKGTSSKSINGLIEKFPNVYQFCNGDLNKFVLLLRKGVYPYEYMDSWEKFVQTLPPKEAFYCGLNLEGISDEDYAHAQKVWELFKINDCGEYHDL